MARMKFRLLVGMALSMLLAVLGAGVAAACSCADQTLEERIANADVVARVLVLEKAEPSDATDSAAPVTYTAQTATLWKGDAPATFTFTSAVSGASCGLEGVEEGQDLVLFAQQAGDGLTSSLCSGTALTNEELVSQLTTLRGEGTQPADAQPTQAPGAEAGWVVPAVIAVLAALGVVWVYARRYQRKRVAAARYASEVKHSDTPTEVGD